MVEIQKKLKPNILAQEEARLINFFQPSDQSVLNRDILRGKIAEGFYTDRFVLKSLPKGGGVPDTIFNIMRQKYNERERNTYHQISFLAQILQVKPEELSKSTDRYFNDFNRNPNNNPIYFFRKIKEYVRDENNFHELENKNEAFKRLYETGKLFYGPDRWNIAVAWEQVEEDVEKEIKEKAKIALLDTQPLPLIKSQQEKLPLEERVERLKNLLYNHGVGVAYGSPGISDNSGDRFQNVAMFVRGNQVLLADSVVNKSNPFNNHATMTYEQIANDCINRINSQREVEDRRDPRGWRSTNIYDVGRNPHIRSLNDIDDAFISSDHEGKPLMSSIPLNSRVILTVKPYDRTYVTKDKQKFVINPLDLPLNEKKWIEVSYYMPIHGDGRSASFMSYTILCQDVLENINLKKEIEELLSESVRTPDAVMRGLFADVFSKYKVEYREKPTELLYRDWVEADETRCALGKIIKFPKTA